MWCGPYLALTSNQEVFSCGCNEDAQLGREIEDNSESESEEEFSIDDGEYSSKLQKVNLLSDIIRIDCGKMHSMCIDSNNNLFIFGSNFCNQLGLGDTQSRRLPIQHPSLSNIIDVSSRGHTTFVKNLDNEIFGFGNNQYSQAGLQTETSNQTTPIQVLKEMEDIWCSNINKSAQKSGYN